MKYILAPFLVLLSLSVYSQAQAPDDHDIAKVTNISTSNIRITPNPFRQSSVISFNNPDGEKHTFFIYNEEGDLVAKRKKVTDDVRIGSGEFTAGIYSFKFKRKGNDVGSGRIVIR